MKNPFGTRPPSFNAQAINDTIERALTSAGLNTRSGPMHDVTETIRRALVAGGVGDAVRPPVASDSVIELGDDGTVTLPREPSTTAAPQLGRFTTHEFRSAAGSRSYKLYVPAVAGQAGPAPRAMMVMLHGCTQSADDFAAGTQMNRLADEHGFLVVYPEQPGQANASKCWNWFRPQDQSRDGGEPALIAGIVREVAAAQGADPHRVFVAGLSAGAAMAVVLGETYSELFAGVGVHSGLPYRSAHDIPSAMAAMKGGRGRTRNDATQPRKAGDNTGGNALPLIVFHGDRDHTVQQSNGAQIVRQAVDANGSLQVSTQEGSAAGGRKFSRSVHTDGAGHSIIEAWTLHGAGHAWSGGSTKGSYTDATGPDASAEMVRFFLALPRAGSA